MPRTYNYIPDPRFATGPDGQTIDLWAKDPKFSELKMQLRKYGLGTPGPVDLSTFCVSMNQGSLPSCVGNGTCEALEVLENIAHQGISGYEATPLSRMFVWAMARTQEGTLDQVTGCFTRTAMTVIQTLGVCAEALWPYEAGLATTSPSLLAQRQALGHTIQSAYRIDTLAQDRVNDVITALQASHPVVFGTDVTNAFEGLTGAGPVDVPQPTASIAGGHCMVVVGWDGANFKVKNSWGTDWGDGGFCLMTPAYIEWDNTTDLWVPTIGPAAFLRRPQ